MHDRDRSNQCNSSANTTTQESQNQSQGQIPARRTSVVVDTTSCLPSRGSKKSQGSNPDENIDSSGPNSSVPMISAPTTFKHAVKVTFNEEFSRFIYNLQFKY